MEPELAAKLIPFAPAVAAIIGVVCCWSRRLRLLGAVVCILGIGAAFLLSLSLRDAVGHGVATTLFNTGWIDIGHFSAGFDLFVDPLTLVMLCVITGVGALVAVYASGYMAGNRGYARFFACVGLFLFAMITLVMADNLLLLYLGWEGVGLCSYLLIGFYYDRPLAVAAAKKAFIVNRIGDFGFAIGIFLTYTTFDTVQLSQIAAQAETLALSPGDQQAAHHWIPFLLMLGAFGKSAQIPLYVWLPDAMEGPTPVSALIHAATMVTAGVYLITRLFPLFELSPHALPTVATIGAVTALFAATIAACQHDLKRVFAYSTISQLGYMFLGIGMHSKEGAIFHLLTHAFFKALLFLTAGSVMHAMAGQLDMRHISGLRRRMPVTCGLMFIGCLALAGFPYVTAGFYSKDMIIAAAMTHAHDHASTWAWLLTAIALVTAGLTAYYTFRLWFRVFLGPEAYEMGDEHGSHDTDTSKDGIHVEHHQEPHEVGWLMNAPLLVLAAGALFGGMAGHWVTRSVGHSGAYAAHHGETWWLGMGAHGWTATLSAVAAVGGISTAAYYHWLNRPAADQIAEVRPGLVQTLRAKYYVDEIYDGILVRPMRLVGEIFFVIDRLLVDGCVAFIGLVPRLAGLTVQPLQRGSLQGYGLGMAAGVAVLVFLALVLYETSRSAL